MEEVKTEETKIENEELELMPSAAMETAPAVVEPKNSSLTMWNDLNVFETTQRMGKLLATSNIVPQAYRGKLADCVIAIDIANRMGLSPLAVMQSSQVVQGNFSWKGTACKAMIDSCGKYKSTRYVEVGERGKDTWGYYLEATTKDDKIVNGVTVDIAIAKKEGWYGKSGSKWQTMPELMLKYRAAAFFMRTECAGLAMGFLTAEENEDVYGTNSKEDKNSLFTALDEEIKGE